MKPESFYDLKFQARFRNSLKWHWGMAGCVFYFYIYTHKLFFFLKKRNKLLILPTSIFFSFTYSKQVKTFIPGTDSKTTVGSWDREKPAG